ncbi:uncharacterized protein LOC126965714 isoform X2 [Leptidea sinapis]|nr:uncharacterized protein LOC126965714 isoform X2 [Leptidea sinapis]
MDRDKFKRRDSNNDESYDEVDNIMSKFAREKTCTSAQQHQILSREKRRKTSEREVDDDDSEDEEDENQSYDPSDAEDQNNSLSRSTSRSHITSNISFSKSNENIGYWIYILVIILIAIIAYFTLPEYLINRSVEKTANLKNLQLNFFNEVESLAREYNVDSESMLQIRSGIRTIFENQDTGSFIFTYDGDSKKFDPRSFDNFMKDITSAVSRYLRNYSNDIKQVIFDTSEEISSLSDVDLMRKYRHVVDRVGVLLVKDIDKLPSSLAMAFHYYCDEYNPLVKKSAIFFTINAAQCSIPPSQKPNHSYIERCLKKRWTSIESDKIGPLLTRVVNVIVDVRNS